MSTQRFARRARRSGRMPWASSPSFWACYSAITVPLRSRCCQPTLQRFVAEQQCVKSTLLPADRPLTCHGPGPPNSLASVRSAQSAEPSQQSPVSGACWRSEPDRARGERLAAPWALPGAPAPTFRHASQTHLLDVASPDGLGSLGKLPVSRRHAGGGACILFAFAHERRGGGTGKLACPFLVVGAAAPPGILSKAAPDCEIPHGAKIGRASCRERVWMWGVAEA